MPNLTLAIDDTLLREARIKAVQDGTSVNEICRKAIEQYVGRQSQGDALASRLQASFARALPRAPDAAPAWQGRDALYAERMDGLAKRRRK